MDNHQAPHADNSVTPTAPPLDDSQLPFRVWLSRNGVYLAVAVALFIALYFWVGPQGVWAIGKVVLGLTFVIFFHELGHFAIAKWCDVHVETFSIGFGPALPGCSFQKGETTYKLALIPLGGYVKMVGEGTDEEEKDAQDPRSFQNKTVGQRMAIISAGVIMNVFLGCVCFVIAYRNGIEEIAGVIAATEPGSPAWKKGVHDGMVIKQIANIHNPSYVDLKYEVMLSQKGQPIAFTFLLPDDDDPSGSRTREIPIVIEPRREEYDSAPVIGVLPASQLVLHAARDVKKAGLPLVSGPAAAARELSLRPDDLVVATTDPDHPDEEPLPLALAGKETDYAGLAERLERLAGKPVKLTIKRGDRDDVKPVEPVGFEPGDRIVGTSDDGPDNKPYNPYRLKKLPEDTIRDPKGHQPNYFVYLHRMQNLADKPVVLQVVRDKAGASDWVAVFVPPAFHATLGLRMYTGKVSAIREGSPAQQAGVQANDVLDRVEMRDGDGQKAVWSATQGKDPPPDATQRILDPLRLPAEMRQWAKDRTDVKVTLTVLRDQHHDMDKQRTLNPVAWDAAWKHQELVPLSPRSPTAIAELGIAYQVETRIAAVADKSAAQKAGLQPGDVILEVRFKETPRKGAAANWGSWRELWTKDSEQPDDKRPEPWWVQPFFALQGSDTKEVQLKVRRGTETLPEVELTATPDKTWPLDERGLVFMYDRRLKQAGNTWEALGMGADQTYRTIVQVYLGLYGSLTNRISAKKNLQGPIGIATMAYAIAGEDIYMLIAFLGMISVNLAVVNFLPIPLLDGGHMLLLIYEKVRGKPASIGVRTALAYLGLLLLVSIMIFAFYGDIRRLVVGS